MAMYTTNANLSFLPDQIGALVVQPVTRESVAIQASTTIRAAGHRYRIPIVNTDPAAVWVAEGAEITPSDPTLSELVIDQYKIAGLTVVSNEMLADATPESSALIGARIAADIARKVDGAFFGSKGASNVQPAGLADLPTTGANKITVVSAGGSWSNLDVFSNAAITTSALGVQVGAYVTSTADALAIGTLKDSSVSNRSLLSPRHGAARQARHRRCPRLRQPRRRVRCGVGATRRPLPTSSSTRTHPPRSTGRCSSLRTGPRSAP